MNKNYVTKSGYKMMLDELNYMLGPGIQEAITMIADARDKGDLSENAEYEAAKNYHEAYSKKIGNLKEKIDNSQIITPIKNNGRINMLSTVRIKNQNGQILNWTLVPENEIDIKEGKISFNSPVGSALLGKSLGETVDIEVPSGKMQLEILEIN
jgi:transcription elongation factor GreA